MSDVGRFLVRLFETTSTEPLAPSSDWRAAATAASVVDGVDAATVEADGGDGRTLAIAVKGSSRLAWDCTESEVHEPTGEVTAGIDDSEVAALTDRVVRCWAETESGELAAPVSDAWICLSELRSALMENGETRTLLMTAETVRPNGTRDVHSISYFLPGEYVDWFIDEE
jgi:hypothetical protein